jgi:hypothetical protein
VVEDVEPMLVENVGGAERGGIPYGGGCTGACGTELGQGGSWIGSEELGQGCGGGATTKCWNIL